MGSRSLTDRQSSLSSARDRPTPAVAASTASPDVVVVTSEDPSNFSSPVSRGTTSPSATPLSCKVAGKGGSVQGSPAPWPAVQPLGALGTAALVHKDGSLA